MRTLLLAIYLIFALYISLSWSQNNPLNNEFPILNNDIESYYQTLRKTFPNPDSYCEILATKVNEKLTECHSYAPNEVKKAHRCFYVEHRPLEIRYNEKCKKLDLHSQIKTFQRVAELCFERDLIGSICPVALRNLGTLYFEIEEPFHNNCQNQLITNTNIFVQDYLPEDTNEWSNCNWNHAEHFQKRKQDLLSNTKLDDRFKLMADLGYVYFCLGKYELSKLLLTTSIDLFPDDKRHEKVLQTLLSIYSKTGNDKKLEHIKKKINSLKE